MAINASYNASKNFLQAHAGAGDGADESWLASRCACCFCAGHVGVPQASKVERADEGKPARTRGLPPPWQTLSVPAAISATISVHAVEQPELPLETSVQMPLGQQNFSTT
jgi:hypothetical protein